MILLIDKVKLGDKQLMNKTICILLVAILVSSSIGFVSTADNIKIEVKESSFEFANFRLIKENQQVNVLLDGTNSFTIQSGRPLLPSLIKTYIFPSNTLVENVVCTPQNIQHEHVFQDISLAPDMIQLSSGEKVEPIPSDSFSVYPIDWYDVTIGHGLIEGKRSVIVRVECYPVRYHEAEKKVSWIDEIDVKIEYKSSVTSSNFEEQYDLLIISPIEFTNELDPLVDHKNNRDISTISVHLDQIYNGDYFPVEGRDEPEKIKYFIKNAYDTWGISNVMLVGGRYEMPSRETHVQVSNSDKEIFLSDIYYADIYNGSLEFSTWDTNNNDVFAEYQWEGNTDEIDLYPDVKIGRVACINEEQVTTIVNKIITYENTKAFTKDWFGNLVVIGADTFPGDDKGIDEGEFVNQAIIDVMDGFSTDKIWYSNGRINGIAPTGVQNINDGINEGCGFLDFSGHGAPYLWTTYPHNVSRQILPSPTGSYSNSMISNLENKDKLPIVVCGGCSLGKFEANSNCFAWSFLSNPDGGGIASFGATGLGYVYIGEYVTYGLVEGLNLRIFEAYDNGAITFGEMWLDAVNDYLGSFNLNAGDYKTLEEWHPFGDPTLAISTMSEEPVTPDAPSGPTSGRIGEKHEYTAVTTDPEDDDLYYFFEWSEDDNSGWLGPYESGETCTGSFIWEKRGEYQIRVKARDEHGSVSGWSEYLPVSMPRYSQYSLFYEFLSNHPVFHKLFIQLV